MRRCVESYPVTRDRDGSLVSVSAHWIGERPGPTLGLVGGQHGDEWFAARLLREVTLQVETWDFNGTVVVVPAANPPALRDGTRITQHTADEPDLNRVWPSGRTWLASQLATTLAEQVVDKCDALIDHHLGIWGSTFGGVCYPQDLPDSAVTAASRRLAFAYGQDCVERLDLVGAFPGPRSLNGYASAVRGIPAINVEVGGAGFGATQEEAWIAQAVRGVRNVMISLGMLDGGITLPERVLETGPTVIVCPRNGGLLVPERDADSLLRQVVAGEVLGRVYSLQTLELLEEVTSPLDGWLFCIPRTYAVRPGDWGFAVAPSSDAHWIQRSELLPQVI